MKRSLIAKTGVALLAIGILGSCQKQTSSSTGWEYNNMENGGFEKKDFEEQETGPGLVMVEGGTFTMGKSEEDVIGDNNNRTARVTVSSFYMDRTEVTNFHWLEYVYWMKRVYYKSYPHIYKKALPDTLVWRSPLSYKEKFVDYYFRHPSYRDYPVVGVSWNQANDFCKWRTDRVNEFILVREGILEWHFQDKGDLGAASSKDYNAKYSNSPENMFNTESYLAGQYNVERGKETTDKNGNKSYEGYTLQNGNPKEVKDKKGNQVPRDPYQLNNFDPVYAQTEDNESFYQGKRQVRMEDGFLLPKYRLPTEAEWEYAALGLIGNLDPKSENIDERRIYPWDGHYVRYDEEQFQGSIQANFVRGRGDLMGVAGALNDGADVTARVDEYWPNDFGLYNMAGNVSEWVMDTYRPMSSEVFDEFMPFRGNVYQTKLLVPNGLHDKAVKTTDNIYDVHGMKEFVNEYARVLYARHGNIDLNLDNNYKSNFIDQKEKERRARDLDNATLYIATKDGTTTFNGNKDSIAIVSKFNGNGTLTNRKWEITGPGKVSYKIDTITKKSSEFSDTAWVSFDQIGKYSIKLSVTDSKGGKTSAQLADYINVKDKAEKPYINSDNQKSNIKSRQDMRKYQFNNPSSYYTSNGRKLTTQDWAQFVVLDDLNALLDTAIMMYNRGNTVKASAYIEKVFYNNTPTSNLSIVDFRDKDKYDPENSELNVFGVYIKDKDDTTLYKATSVFNDEYMEAMFPNYKQDQTVSTWLLNLRNGLSEYTIESRGKQRWRNVTEEENLGRLNYRKDDYVDYLDGDLESSIFYNNAKRKEDINSGRLSAKNTVYQSQHENIDLNNSPITSNSSGWPTTLISDKSKVYKGGSWADRSYWLSPGNRRFLDEDKASAMIGFRCAMDRLGGQRNENYKPPKR